MSKLREIDTWRRSYERDGFVVIPELISDETRGSLRLAIDQLVSEYDPSQDRSVFRTDDGDHGRDDAFFRSASGVQGFLEADAIGADGSLVVPVSQCLNKVGHALHDHLPAFRALARSQEIRDALSVAGLDHAKIVQSMVIFKQPKIGGDVRWHQDASYLISHPARVAGVWIALEDATLENGCLWVAPGAHRGPLRERYEVDWDQRKGTLTTLDDTPWPQESEALALEVSAGDVVVFHDHLPHRSLANSSAQSRVAVTLHAHLADAKWPRENWLQRTELPDFIIGEA